MIISVGTSEGDYIQKLFKMQEQIYQQQQQLINQQKEATELLSKLVRYLQSQIFASPPTQQQQQQQQTSHASLLWSEIQQQSSA